MYRYRLSISDPICHLHQLIGYLDCSIEQCKEMVEGHVCYLLLQSGPKSQYSFDEQLQSFIDNPTRTTVYEIIHDHLIAVLRPAIADEAIYIEFSDNGDVEITIDDFYEQNCHSIDEDPRYEYALGSGRP